MVIVGGYAEPAGHRRAARGHRRGDRPPRSTGCASSSAELVAVDRPAADGDHVTIDITGKQRRRGRSPASPPTTTSTRSAAARSCPSSTTSSRGAKVGDILEFTAAHPDPDEDPHRLPGPREGRQGEGPPRGRPTSGPTRPPSSTRSRSCAPTSPTRAALVKQVQAQMAVRETHRRGALAELVTDELPEALVGAEMQTRLQDLAMRLQAQGMGIEQYLAATGRTARTLIEELRGRRRRGGARSTSPCGPSPRPRSIEVTDEELEDEIVAHGRAHVDEKPDKVPRPAGADRPDAGGTLGPAQGARRSTGSSSTSRWSTRTGEPIDRALLETDAEHDRRSRRSTERRPTASATRDGSRSTT